MNDEQRSEFEKWYKVNHNNYDMPTSKLGGYMMVEHASAWEAWKAAQQVKPLEFVHTQNALLIADTGVGQFIVYPWKDVNRYAGRSYDTEAEAIAAANADYQRRVLSCLVHGGKL